MRNCVRFFSILVVLGCKLVVAQEQWVDVEPQAVRERISAWRAAQSTVGSAEFNFQIENESPHSLEELYEKANKIELVRSTEKFLFLGEKRLVRTEIFSTPFLKPIFSRQVTPGVGASGMDPKADGLSKALKRISTTVFDGKHVVVKRGELTLEYSIESWQKEAPGSLVPWVFGVMKWPIHDSSVSKELSALNAGLVPTSMTSEELEKVKCWEEQTNGWLRFEIPATKNIPISSKLIVDPRNGWLVLKSEGFDASNRLVRRTQFSDPQTLTPQFSVPGKIRIEGFDSRLGGSSELADTTTHVVVVINRVNELNEEEFKQELKPGTMVLDMRPELKFSEDGVANVDTRIVAADGTIVDEVLKTQPARNLWKIALGGILIGSVSILTFAWKLHRKR